MKNLKKYLTKYATCITYIKVVKLTYASNSIVIRIHREGFYNDKCYWFDGVDIITAIAFITTQPFELILFPDVYELFKDHIICEMIECNGIYKTLPPLRNAQSMYMPRVLSYN